MNGWRITATRRRAPRGLTLAAALLLACSGDAGGTDSASASDSSAATTQANTGAGATETTAAATSAGPTGGETDSGTSSGGTTAAPTTSEATDPTVTTGQDTTTSSATSVIETTGAPTTGGASTGPGTTSGTTGDGTTGGTTGALDCGDADVALILASFELCDNPPQQVGQSASAPSVTCEQVCCAMGLESCVYRAAQADYDACNPPNANQSGSCADVFQPAWSSQCLCS